MSFGDDPALLNEFRQISKFPDAEGVIYVMSFQDKRDTSGFGGNSVVFHIAHIDRIFRGHIVLFQALDKHVRCGFWPWYGEKGGYGVKIVGQPEPF